MSKLHFIYNPVAGLGVSRKAFAAMQALLQEQHVDYSFSTTEYAGHAPLLTARAIEEGPDCIVAVGGDGTVREVASAMLGASVPIGVFPCGTGNDFAKSLHIPAEPAAALKILQKGRMRALDVGVVNDMLFFNVAGLGFDVDVLEKTQNFKKRFKGLFAYVLGLLSALAGLHLRRIKVTTDQGEFYHNALVVEVGNGTHIGGGMNVTPLADPCDGLFDICIISDVTKLTVLKVLTRFIKGKHLGMDITTYYKAKSLFVESDPPSPLQLDGEIMGTTPASFYIRPGVIQIVC
ncbi:MAG: diacylglycerol kinase family lipid kinase [Clostridiales bacterium]|nr:diacylglycerol kinase family lipid kinase [Clostridiales bacterium]